MEPCCFAGIQQTTNNAVEMSQVFHIVPFEGFKDRNLLKPLIINYAFNVNENWETQALRFYFH